MNNIYVPFYYLERIKRPGKAEFLRQILTDDLPILVLALTWLSPHPLVHGISMIILLISFWCIYEIGYWENDRVGEQFEQYPTLSETYHLFENKIPILEPWIWALIFAIPGLILLELSKVPQNLGEATWQFNTFAITQISINTVFWLGLLVFVRITFWAFNHVNEQTRIWIYPLLQATKYFGFLGITITNTIGTMMFVSQVISRWLPYFFYRWGDDKKKFTSSFPKRLVRLLLFSMLLIALSLGDRSVATILNWQVLIIFSLYFLRSSKDIWEVISKIGPISQVKLNHTTVQS